MYQLRTGAVLRRRQPVTTYSRRIQRPDPVVHLADQTGHRTGLARAVTEILAPANLAVAQLLLVGWHSIPGPAGLGWGLLAATFCGLIPYGIVIAGVRRRRWTDRHLRTRRQRPTPLLAAIGSVVAGLVVLVALDAPGSWSRSWSRCSPAWRPRWW